MASVLPGEHPNMVLLLISTPPSSSPFPSPSSSFNPPPSLVETEFASRPPTRLLRRKKVEEPTPITTIVPPTPAPLKRHSDMQSAPPQTIEIPPPETTSATLSSFEHALISSRPAPLSPSASRRASTALSQRSNASSKTGGSVSRHPSPSTRRQSKLQSLTPASSTNGKAIDQTAHPRRRSLILRIRDFAFPATDDRHQGNGPDAPKSNKPRRALDDEDHDDIIADGLDFGEEKRNSGWSGFMLSSFVNRLSWGFGRGKENDSSSSPSSANSQAESGVVDTPSKIDFALNFDVSSPMEEKQTMRAAAEDDEDGEYDYEEQEDGGPLFPGKYRALFAFEPEGTAEMQMKEDQIVNVVGRGGGVGWAVVEKDDGGYALVPESYLELVELKQ